MCPTKNRLSLRASVSFGFFMSGEAGKRGSGEARQGGGEARQGGGKARRGGEARKKEP